MRPSADHRRPGFIGSNLARRAGAPGRAGDAGRQPDPQYGGNPFNVDDIRDAGATSTSPTCATRFAMAYLVQGTGLPVQPGRPDQPPRLDDRPARPTSTSTPPRSCRSSRPAASTTRACGSCSPARASSTAGRTTCRSTRSIRSARSTSTASTSWRASGTTCSTTACTASAPAPCGSPTPTARGMRVKDARQTFLGIWITQLLDGQADQGVRRRTAAARLQLRRRLRRGACCSPPRSTRPIGKVYNLGSSEVVVAERRWPMSDRRRWWPAAAYEIVPFPPDRKAIDIGDYYSDFALDHAPSWAGSRRSTSQEGLAQTIDYYRRTRPALLGCRTHDPDERLQGRARPNCASASPTPRGACSTRAGTSWARRCRPSEAEWAAACGAAHCVGVGNGMDAIEIGAARARHRSGRRGHHHADDRLRHRAGHPPGRRDAGARRHRRRHAPCCPGQRRRCIIAAHPGGAAGAPVRAVRDMAGLGRAAAAKHGIELIEDCAQSHLAAWDGQHGGQLRRAPGPTASTRPRTSAPSATAARSSPIGRHSPSGSAAAQLRPERSATSIPNWASTAGSTSCRPRCCCSACGGSTSFTARRRAHRAGLRRRHRAMPASPAGAAQQAAGASFITCLWCCATNGRHWRATWPNAACRR